VGDVFHIVLMANGFRLAALSFWGAAEDAGDRKPIAASLALLSAAIIVGGGIVAAVSAPALAHLLRLNDPTVLVAGIAATLLKITTVMPLALMQARYESTRFVVATTAIAASQILLTLLGLVFLEGGVWGILAALGLSHGGIGLFLTFRELRRSSFRPSAKHLRQTIRFAAPLVPAGACFFVLNSGDQLFLAHYSGAAALGIYAFAYRISQAVVLFAVSPLTQVWSAAMFELYRRPDRSVEFGRTITRILGGFAMAGAALMLFQREVVAILGSESFAVDGRVLALIVIAQFFMVASNLIDSAFYVTRRTDLKPWIALVAAVAMLAAYAWLIPLYGALGAAAATLAGFAFTACVTGLVARRVFVIRIEMARLCVLLSFLVLSATLEWGLHRAGFEYWSSLALRALFLAGAPVVAWKVGFVTDAEKKYAAGTAHQILALAHHFRLAAPTRTR
jgi:O-antigen/teichoic acid export membrane protein